MYSDISFVCSFVVFKHGVSTCEETVHQENQCLKPRALQLRLTNEDLSCFIHFRDIIMSLFEAYGKLYVKYKRQKKDRIY